MTTLTPLYISDKIFTDETRLQLAMDLHDVRTHLHKYLDVVAAEAGLTPREVDAMEMGIFEHVENQYNIRPLLTLLDYYGEPIDLNLSNYH